MKVNLRLHLRVHLKLNLKVHLRVHFKDVSQEGDKKDAFDIAFDNALM